jgi:hypothetical protein
MELTVTKEKVLEAAKTSDSAKEALKVLFPDVFKVESEYFDFSNKNTLTYGFNGGPLLVGWGTALSGDRNKVLIVGDNYELEVIPNYCGIRTGLKFKKKG